MFGRALFVGALTGVIIALISFLSANEAEAMSKLQDETLIDNTDCELSHCPSIGFHMEIVEKSFGFGSTIPVPYITTIRKCAPSPTAPATVSLCFTRGSDDELRSLYEVTYTGTPYKDPIVTNNLLNVSTPSDLHYTFDFETKEFTPGCPVWQEKGLCTQQPTVVEDGRLVSSSLCFGGDDNPDNDAVCKTYQEVNTTAPANVYTVDGASPYMVNPDLNPTVIQGEPIPLPEPMYPTTEGAGVYIPDSGVNIPDSGVNIPDSGVNIPDSGTNLVW